MAYTVEPFTPPAQITIKGTGVRLRAEPFASQDVPVLSHGSTGLVLNVVGIARLPDWNWYQVVLRSGQKAFIRSDYTSAPSKRRFAGRASATCNPDRVSPGVVACHRFLGAGFRACATDTSSCSAYAARSDLHACSRVHTCSNLPRFAACDWRSDLPQFPPRRYPASGSPERQLRHRIRAA